MVIISLHFQASMGDYLNNALALGVIVLRGEVNVRRWGPPPPPQGGDAWVFCSPGQTHGGVRVF